MANQDIGNPAPFVLSHTARCELDILGLGHYAVRYHTSSPNYALWSVIVLIPRIEGDALRQFILISSHTSEIMLD